MSLWAKVQGWRWLEIIQALAAVWVAVVATRALKTWKAQSKAERQGKLLDDLIEAIHEYLGTVKSPLTIAEFVKIGMTSHEPSHLPGDHRIEGAIAYINAAGADTAKRLFDAIRECRPSHERVLSLLVKGQVLQFRNYSRGYNSAIVIAHQLGKCEAIAAMISSSSLNWENPVIRQHLETILAIDVDATRKEIETQHREFLSFAEDAYAQIYE